MIRWVAFLTGGLALAFAATPTRAGEAAMFGSAERVTTVPVPAASPAPEMQPERRVLVMLRLAPEHYRPSSDYGGAGGYGDASAAAARRRTAAGIARDNRLTLLDTWPMPILGVDCVVMLVPGDEPLQAVADRLSRDRRVA